MLKVEWKFQGRKIRSGKELGRAVSDWVKAETSKALVAHVEDKMRGLRCTVHGQVPQVVKSPVIGKLSIKGCCEEVIAEARKRLSD